MKISPTVCVCVPSEGAVGFGRLLTAHDHVGRLCSVCGWWMGADGLLLPVLLRISGLLPLALLVSSPFQVGYYNWV